MKGIGIEVFLNFPPWSIKLLLMESITFVNSVNGRDLTENHFFQRKVKLTIVKIIEPGWQTIVWGRPVASS